LKWLNYFLASVKDQLEVDESELDENGFYRVKAK
jgi:hypothetical protein